MKAKRDLSRLVMLDMTPSEAVLIAAAIQFLRDRTIDQDELQVLNGALLHIKAAAQDAGMAHRSDEKGAVSAMMLRLLMLLLGAWVIAMLGATLLLH